MEIGLEELVIPQLLERRAAELGESPYFTFGDTTYSYRETYRRARHIGAAMQRFGIERGATVGIMSENSPELMFTWFGLALAGIMPVPINPGMKGDFLENILTTAKIQAVVVEERALQNVLELADRSDHLRAVIVVGDHAGASRQGIELACYDSLLNGDALSAPVPQSFRDPFQILFTSGTTGRAKGILMPHGHLAHLSLAWIEATGLSASDRIYMPMQMYHANGNYAMVAGLLTGCSLEVDPKFSASRFWQRCRESEATVALCSISLYNIFLTHPPSPQDKDHKVRAFWQTPTDRAFDARFNVGTACGYGTTEIGQVALGRYDDLERPEGSPGKPNEAFFEVQIVDENDLPVPPGVVGEVVARPRRPYSMMLGYFGNSDATVDTWKNLWHHTGDLAYLDENGYLFFKSRKKDVIRRRGENISATEVERVLLEHPLVAECAALAYPSELSEDEVRVVIVPRGGAPIDPEELVEHCQARMPAFMVPRYIEFRDSLPRTAHNNRIEKYKLQQEGLGPNVWDREKHS